MPQPKLLTEGDFLTMDFGCMYQGYCSDMTRTIHIGEVVESEQKKVYDTVLQAQLAALSVVKPARYVRMSINVHVTSSQTPVMEIISDMDSDIVWDFLFTRNLVFP